MKYKQDTEETIIFTDDNEKAFDGKTKGEFSEKIEDTFRQLNYSMSQQLEEQREIFEAKLQALDIDAKIKNTNLAIETINKANQDKEETIKGMQTKINKSKDKVDYLNKKVKELQEYSEDLVKINKSTKISLQEMPLVLRLTDWKQHNEIIQS